MPAPKKTTTKPKAVSKPKAKTTVKPKAVAKPKVAPKPKAKTTAKPKSKTKQNLISKPQVQTLSTNIDEEFPHDMFPWKLVFKDGTEKRTCYFQCEEHRKKHITRYNLKKSNIIFIGYKYD